MTVSAEINYPQRIAFDAANNLYIADLGSQRVRKVTPQGIIGTVAGTGALGSSGDGAQAVNANLRYPIAVSLDSLNNLYILEFQNAVYGASSLAPRVRKVSQGGVITTVAGNGINFSYGDGGPATSASLYSPSDIALDSSGNLYIVDGADCRVRKVAGGIISTIAGTGACLPSPDGLAAASSLNYPYRVSLDSFDNLYIGERSRVRKIAANQTMLTTFAGTGVGGYSGDGGSPL